jgi:EmrB/QacA subfamily drug resistance transporter
MVPATIDTTDITTPAASYRWRWVAFSAILMASTMDLLDTTIANVAAPTIRQDLAGSYADLQWITAGYTVALAVVMLPGGRLGDMFGRKRMLMVGLGGFTLSSLACAVAPSLQLLIVARILQGAFAALMLPQGFGLMRDLFEQHEMPKVWSVFGPVMSMTGILGPIVGGLLIGADLFGAGWRSIFLVNLPIGALAFIIGVRLIPDASSTARSSQLNPPSVALAAAGAFMLVFPIVQGRELGWPMWVQVMLAASIPVFVAFAAYQVRIERRGATPLVEPSVFRKRTYTSGIAFALTFYTVIGGITLAFTVMLQLGLGYTPLRASLTMVPWGIGSFVGAGLARVMMAKVDRMVLHIGLVVMGTGLATVSIIFRLAEAGVGSWDLAVPLVVCGIGMSMIFTLLFNVIMGCIAPHEMGSASSVLQAVRGLGISVGIAGLGTLYFGLADAPAGQGPHTATGSAPFSMGFVRAADETLLVAVGLIALAFLLGFLIPRSARAPHPAEPVAAVARRDPSESATAQPTHPAEQVAEADDAAPDHPPSARSEDATAEPASPVERVAEAGETAPDSPSARAEHVTEVLETSSVGG